MRVVGFFIGMLQLLQEQCYPFLSVCEVFSFVDALPALGFFDVYTDVDGGWGWGGGWPDIVKESALKVDSVRKVPCHMRESNRHQYCTGFSVQQSTDGAVPPWYCDSIKGVSTIMISAGRNCLYDGVKLFTTNAIIFFFLYVCSSTSCCRSYIAVNTDNCS